MAVPADKMTPNARNVIMAIINDVRTVIMVFTTILVVSGYLIDTRYPTYTYVNQVTSSQEIRQIRREIKDLEYQKSFEIDEKKVKVLEGRIRIREQDIKDIYEKESKK